MADQRFGFDDDVRVVGTITDPAWNVDAGVRMYFDAASDHYQVVMPALYTASHEFVVIANPSKNGGNQWATKFAQEDGNNLQLTLSAESDVTFKLNWKTGAVTTTLVTSTGDPTQAPFEPETGGCCTQTTAECLACTAGVEEDEFCFGKPTTAGCEAYAWPTSAVSVQLFMWKYQDVASHCQDLADAGYRAVLVSPPNEHALITDSPWYERYQPVSYDLVSSSGDEDDVKAMLAACHAAGVHVWADAVINHMANDPGTTLGSNSSAYDPATRTFPNWQPSDFNPDCIDGAPDGGNPTEVCALVGLPDLATGNPDVRFRLAQYLDYLLTVGEGFDGIRIDAAKHMGSIDTAAIVEAMQQTPRFLVQEVIASADSDPNDYTSIGAVTDFGPSYDLAKTMKVKDGRSLRNLMDMFGSVDSDSAHVFVDNHDLQRHGESDSLLTYLDGQLHVHANCLLLALNYGHVRVMSSYEFGGEFGQGPPSTAPCGDNSEWKCEHLESSVVAMLKFKNVAGQQGLTNWYSDGGEAIAFGRGAKAHFALNNNGYLFLGEVDTSLPDGSYCNVLVADCQHVLQVQNGKLALTLPSQTAVAIHVESAVSVGAAAGTCTEASGSVTASAAAGTDATQFSCSVGLADGVYCGDADCASAYRVTGSKLDVAVGAGQTVTLSGSALVIPPVTVATFTATGPLSTTDGSYYIVGSLSEVGGWDWRQGAEMAYNDATSEWTVDVTFLPLGPGNTHELEYKLVAVTEDGTSDEWMTGNNNKLSISATPTDVPKVVWPEVSLEVDVVFVLTPTGANVTAYYVTGSFANWPQPGTNEDLRMVKGSDGKWTVTVKMTASSHDYKFFAEAGWNGGEQVPYECQNQGTSDNRFIEVTGADTIEVPFGKCPTAADVIWHVRGVMGGDTQYWDSGLAMERVMENVYTQTLNLKDGDVFKFTVSPTDWTGDKLSLCGPNDALSANDKVSLCAGDAHDLKFQNLFEEVTPYIAMLTLNADGTAELSLESALDVQWYLRGQIDGDSSFWGEGMPLTKLDKGSWSINVFLKQGDEFKFTACPTCWDAAIIGKCQDDAASTLSTVAACDFGDSSNIKFEDLPDYRTEYVIHFEVVYEAGVEVSLHPVDTYHAHGSLNGEPYWGNGLPSVVAKPDFSERHFDTFMRQGDEFKLSTVQGGENEAGVQWWQSAFGLCQDDATVYRVGDSVEVCTDTNAGNIKFQLDNSAAMMHRIKLTIRCNPCGGPDGTVTDIGWGSVELVNLEAPPPTPSPAPTASPELFARGSFEGANKWDAGLRMELTGDKYTLRVHLKAGDMFKLAPAQSGSWDGAIGYAGSDSVAVVGGSATITVSVSGTNNIQFDSPATSTYYEIQYTAGTSTLELTDLSTASPSSQPTAMTPSPTPKEECLPAFNDLVGTYPLKPYKPWWSRKEPKPLPFVAGNSPCGRWFAGKGQLLPKYPHWADSWVNMTARRVLKQISNQNLCEDECVAAARRAESACGNELGSAVAGVFGADAHMAALNTATRSLIEAAEKAAAICPQFQDVGTAASLPSTNGITIVMSALLSVVLLAAY